MMKVGPWRRVCVGLRGLRTDYNLTPIIVMTFPGALL
jgi:hypothetical protein